MTPRAAAGETARKVLQTLRSHRSMWTLVLATTAALVAATHLGTAAAGPSRPHILFILIDDMGWNDVGFTGNSDLQTPNIDTLAYNGRVLRQHYALPTCTPSRAALLTGKYPIRTGMQGYPLSPAEPRALPLDQKLLPQYLKELGYRTHLLGKWHLGYYDWKYTPLSRGFDTHFGYMNGFIGYYNHHMSVKNQSGHDFWRGTQQLPHLKGRYVTDVLVEEAERLIDETAKDDEERPMFMMLSHLGVHSGNPGSFHEFPGEDIERFAYIPDENRRKYAAMVWNLDKSVGRVVKSLAKNGILDDTIIVLMSDNGAPTIGLYPNDGSNYPMRGLKFTMLEGGLKTVAAVWSAGIHAKQLGSLDNLFHMTDWLPTLYVAAGGNLTDLSGLDGMDQWKNIVRKPTGQGVAKSVNEEYKTRKEILLNIDENLGLSGIRYKNWKYLNGSFINALYEWHFGDYRNDKYSYSTIDLAKSDVAKFLHKAFPAKEVINKSFIAKQREENTITCGYDANQEVTPCDLRLGPCLFDLDTDPCEQNNLIESRPEIVQFLLAKLETYFTQLKSQLNTVDDPAANPKLHDGAWVPWRGGSISNSYSSSAATSLFSTKQCLVGALGSIVGYRTLS